MLNLSIISLPASPISSITLDSPPFAVLTSDSLLGALLYLDPGTGSLLFSVIIGIVSTAYFIVKDLLYRVGTRMRMLASPNSSKSTNASLHTEYAAVFYSEGKQYETTFGPLLEHIAHSKTRCLYLSNEPDDPLLKWISDQNNPLLHADCIGSGHMAWARLRTLRANLVCMTTPGLDVMQIRRSPHVRHYMHIVHSPTDKSFNRPYSFDHFDSVVINGPHQQRVIRHLESLRGRKTKALFTVGCIYYDRFVSRYDVALKRFNEAGAMSASRPLWILLAPTWGRNGLLRRYGIDLIRSIAEGNMEIVIRPHPQSVKSESKLINELQNSTARLGNCRWDFSSDPVHAMAASDILISDISGIVFDYAFVTGRPVLTMDFTVDKRGFEAMDLPFEPWEITSLEQIGRRITVEDISQLQSIIQEEIGSKTRATQITRLRDEYVVNFGGASKAAAELIVQIADFGMQQHQAPEAYQLSIEVHATTRS